MSETRSRGSLLYLIKQLELGVRQRLDRFLREQALTVPQYTLLSVLRSSPGLSSAELARRSFVTAQSAHKLVRSLERRGLIARATRPGNRRVLRTHLTEPGLELLRHCDARADGVEDELVALLSSAQTSDLWTTLHRCLRALTDPRASAQSPVHDETDKEPPMTETLDTARAGAAQRFELQALKAFAAREVENVMNKYEYMMSHDQFTYVYDNLFATDLPDVRPGRSSHSPTRLPPGSGPRHRPAGGRRSAIVPVRPATRASACPCAEWRCPRPARSFHRAAGERLPATRRSPAP
ncbi:MarR family winged helix-turn-helix transcriptional regulator [Streptomyces sp. NBC_00988]|uniref:MarR family winged helix-turn-helix transcriptional regulator n=1 Tax=Streptomyces sp. NBC_00988 TaxID=2903704 RepID=UPI00386D3811